MVHVTARPELPEPDAGARIETGTVETALVPSPVCYQALLPPGYHRDAATCPLLLCLHGGVGGHGLVRLMQPVLRDMWQTDSLPPLVAVAPETGHSFYLDYRDGSQRWETFLAGEFLSHLRQRFRVHDPGRGTWVCGISMGGMGALRLGLKHPDRFAGVIAWEPAIEPALAWRDVQMQDRFWRSDEVFHVRFGKPVDEAWWAANNPAAIATEHAEAIRHAGLALYLEVGTDDAYGLHRGAEFLHRALYDRGIRHEYRQVWGADHIGGSIPRRLRDGLEFAGRIMRPDPPDPRVAQLAELVAVQKRRAGLPG